MPIYAYRCAVCGHAKDVLQKISDAPLVECPSCGAPRFEKQVTAAGFQLKGSGWYVTDFRDGGKKGDKKPEAPSDATAANKTDVKTTDNPGQNASGAAAPAGDKAAAAAPAPAPAAAPPPPSGSTS
jgi:putative FmdB family regulatory protein